MKRLIVTALAGSVALLAGTAANALTFAYTGHIDSYTVQTGGWYEINAWGAQGGSYNPVSVQGGLGAMVGGRIYLNAGQTLDIVVGGQGGSYSDSASGGGGGSFVFVASDLDLLLAAGGGGGSAWAGGAGGPGLAGRDGGGLGGGVDGAGGNGGIDGPTIYMRAAGGGAGWLGPGTSGSAIPGSPPPGFVYFGTGGSSAPYFNGGSSFGGFGGGGGAAYNYGGGGGGYSGGGYGYTGGTLRGSGGGGGSYIADQFYDFVGQSGVNADNGLVTIDLLPVPEPATWAMMLLGFFGLGSLLRRRRLSACSPGPLCSPHP